MARQPSDARPLRRLALSGFAAICEALYPDNDCGAPSWRDADMVARAAQLWDELPPQSRLILEALYGGLAAMKALSPARRFALIDSWRTSRIWPLRFVADAVKSSSTMVYLSHPAALDYIGLHDNCILGEAAGATPPLEGGAKRGVFAIVSEPKGNKVAGVKGGA